jgi:hypothetical protein
MSQRNVINTDAVDAYVAAVAELAIAPAAQDWITRSVRRWILREHPRHYLVQRDKPTGGVLLVDPEEETGFDARPYDGDLPDWAEHALDHPPEGGSAIVFLRLDGTLSKRIRRIITWLNEGVPPEEAGAAVNRLGFSQAEDLARKWRRSLKGQRAYGGRESGAVPVFHHYDATIVQLTSASALRFEGNRMRHCAGEYDQLVADSVCEVYSVRDPRNNPHATVEVEPDGTVLQVKGMANGRVDPRWRPAIRAFVQQRNYVVVGDAGNVAVLSFLEGPTLAKLEETLCSREGQRLLRAYRFVGRDTLSFADSEALARLIIARAQYLSSDALHGAFRAFAPPPSQAIRVHPAAGHWVYDMYVPVMRVDLPLALLNMAREGIFRAVELEEPAREILRAAQDRLPALAFRPADSLYNLGPRRQVHWFLDYTWGSAADFLADGDIDITAQRRLRHLALRRRMNQAKARVASRSAPRSAGHEAVRALLDEKTAPFVI